MHFVQMISFVSKLYAKELKKVSFQGWAYSLFLSLHCSGASICGILLFFLPLVEPFFVYNLCARVATVCAFQ